VVADDELVELVSQSRNTNRRALARASSTVSAFGLLPPSLQPKQRSGARMNRARSSGRRLSAEEAAMVKAMLQRGDRHHDIAAWFGVNQGRIAEVKGGELYPEVRPAGPHALPPQGSPGRIALIAMDALSDARVHIDGILSGRTKLRAQDIIESAIQEVGSTARESDRRRTLLHAKRAIEEARDGIKKAAETIDSAMNKFDEVEE
jgi:hypothetical protein